jgi:hypothetical protein
MARRKLSRQVGEVTKRSKKKTRIARAPETASQLLRKYWQGVSSLVGKSELGTVDAIGAAALRVNSRRLTPALRHFLKFYDEFVVWLVDLSLILLDPRNARDENRSYAALSAALCSLSISIRNEVLLGHDISAKVLSRTLAEHADVLALLVLRPDLKSEFEVEDFKKANEFWHRYVKSTKARKLLNEVVGLDELSAEDWLRFRREEDEILSLSSHPTYVAAWMVWLVGPLDARHLGQASLEL